MRVLTVIGNRPQFVKAAAVSRRLRSEHEEVLVHTGQHYDDELSGVFVRELGVPVPEHELGLGGGSNSEQTARMLAALGELVDDLAPDAVMVYGDTNSTLAGALAGAQAGRLVVHVEAGMRSFDRRMPEELNRVLSDHVSDLLLCSSPTAVANLEREHVGGRIVLVGDVMNDVALLMAPRVRARTGILERHGLAPGDYLLATAHRAGNVDAPERLRALVGLLGGLGEPVVWALHPRTRDRLLAADLLDRLAATPGMVVLGPLGYLDFTALLVHARAVLTDSGGVQKEAYLAGVPCLTMRDTTEWVETVSTHWNTLVDLDGQAAAAALQRPRPTDHPPLYGDGRAGERVVEAFGELTPARRGPSPPMGAGR